jgi:hypothetical protein
MNSTTPGSPDTGAPRQYLGKHRGKVLMNIDPLLMNRLLVEVPGLPGVDLSWAMPCTPYAGPGVGFSFLPPIGANVWVEFERGDLMHPIWSGCFWAETELPPIAAIPAFKVLQTTGLTLVINDVPGVGGMRLTVGPPSVEVPVTITIDPTGLRISTLEASVFMNPAAISVSLPPTSVTMSEAGIAAVTTDINITAAATNIEGAVNVAGAVQVEGEVNITGALGTEGDVVIGGVMELGGNLAVAGAVEVAGSVTAAALIGPIF